MAKQIRSEEIYERDIFKNLIESATDSIEKLELMNQQFVEMAGTIKKAMQGAKFNSSKELNDFIKATKEATNVSKEQAKVMQELERLNALKSKSEIELERLEQQRIKSEKERLTLQNKQRQESERVQKQHEKNTKQALDEANAYKQLERTTRELKNESKRLGAELLNLERDGKKATKEYYELEKQFKQVTREAQKGDKALKDLDKQVGDNFRNVGNYEGAVNKLGRGLGALGLAFGVSDVIGSATDTIRNFDQSVADLVSITGAKGDSLKFFKEQAIEMGKGVEGGASNVIEAYKLIGSAKPELLMNAEALNEVTKSAILLSKASGMDLPQSATALTDALNQFGAPAEEAGKFINVLANGALFGSAEIPQVTEALLKFGAVAKTSNVSIQESTALIELLGEKGLKGAEAGTALRNVMLKLSAPDALPKEAKNMLAGLGIDMEKLSDTSVPFAERLKALKPILQDETAQVKMFGTENVVTAKNLLLNIDRVEELTKQMDTQGTVNQQAEDRTKTLNQALIELKGAWDEVVLGFTSGEGASKVLVGSLSFIAQNLGTILSIALKLAVGYGTLIAVQKAQVLWNKIQNTSFKDMFGSLKDAIKGTKDLEGAQKDASGGAKALGTAMKSIGFAIAIELAIQLVTALYDIASGSRQAREDMERLEKASENAMKSATKNIDRIKDKQQKADAQLQRDLNEKKISQDQYNKKVLENSKMTEKELKSNVKVVNQRKQGYKESLEYLETLNKKYEEAKKNGSSGIDEFKRLQRATKKIAEENKIQGDKSWVTFLTGDLDEATTQDVIAQLKANITGANVKIKEYKKELENTSEVVKDNSSNVRANSKEVDENSKSNKKNAKERKENKTTFDEINQVISKQTELLNDLKNIEDQRNIDKKGKEAEDELKNQLKMAEEQGKAETDLMDKLINEETELKRKSIEDNTKFKLKQLDEEFKAFKEEKLKELEIERDKLLAQKDLTEKERNEINANYLDAQKQLNAQIKVEEENTNLEKKKVIEEGANEITAIEKDKSEKIIDYNNQVNDALDKYGEKQKESAKETADKQLEKQKEYYDSVEKLVKLSTDYFIKQSEKKVEAIDSEINALQKQKDFLEQMAMEGNLTAEKSIAQNEKLQAEANKRKQEELKKQERLKLAEMTINTYLKNVESGEKNAITKTITDIGVLTAFINSLPGFYKGTETTVADALGTPQLSGKDGHIIRVDGKEKILNPELSEMTGDLTTKEIAKISDEYLRGNLVHRGNSKIEISQFQNVLMIKKLDELKNTIENKPVTNIEMGEIVGGVVHLIESTKRKNEVVRNIKRFS